MEKIERNNFKKSKMCLVVFAKKNTSIPARNKTCTSFRLKRKWQYLLKSMTVNCSKI